jgi:predicted cupin superfamily sugar epimerase
MHARAAALIRLLRLQPHPEGGYFREVFRSPARVQPHDDRDARPAITTIYFLLAAGQHSRWHRVASDEIWHWYEGDPLELFWIDEQALVWHRHLLGPISDAAQPVHVVPAGCWQAVRPTGAYTLVDCSVGPGFDFADFRLLGDLPEHAAALRTRFPDLDALL